MVGMLSSLGQESVSGVTNSLTKEGQSVQHGCVLEQSAEVGAEAGRRSAVDDVVIDRHREIEDRADLDLALHDTRAFGDPTDDDLE